MSLEPGQILENKYRIVRKIGEGGMGAVYEGENTFIKRRVAIKVLHAHATADAAVLTRFEREAQAAGQIGSDHILEVLDLGQLDNGDRFMVMEFLDGEAMTDRIRRLGSLTPRQVVPLARQALVGLGAAHAAGIVHRDLKPDNLYVLREKAGHKDFVKIIDFGISKFNALSGDMSMTSTGAVMGTPYYMAPEQARGSAVDARTDLYAMGVILYEALAGRVPFDGTSFNDLMFKIVLSDAPELPDSIDPAFRDLVKKAMSREPAARFQNAAEFVAALDDYARAAAFTESSGGRAFDPSFTGARPGGPLGQSAVSQSALAQSGTARTVLGQSGTAQAALAQSGTARTVLGQSGAAQAGLGGFGTTGAPVGTLGGDGNAVAEAKTGGNWAATQGGARSTNRPSKSQGLVLAGVGALVLAAAALFVVRQSTTADEPAAAAAPADGLVPEPAAKPEAPVAKATPVAAVAEPKPEASTPVAPAPAAPAAAPAPAATTKAPATTATKPAAAPAAAKPAPAPATKPAAATPAAKPAATTTPAKKPAGPDFGY